MVCTARVSRWCSAASGSRSSCSRSTAPPVTPYGTDVYPWLEPGWLANSGSAADPSGAADALDRQPVHRRDPGDGDGRDGPVVGVLACQSRDRGAAPRLHRDRRRVSRLGGGKVGRVLTEAFPVPLLELTLGALIIFAACNLVVFQSWNWDNTKLLVYWYLVIALLIGALAATGGGVSGHAWRRSCSWPRCSSLALWSCSGSCPGRRRRTAITGPYTIANTQELQLASTIDRVTPEGAVVLTFGRPNDPVLAVAGRIGVMGYGGWLWSYGISFETRYNDVQTMYNGCAADQATCPVLRSAAQVRHQLCGDRQPADRRRRDRSAGRAQLVGRPGVPRRRTHRPHHHLRRPWQGLT